MVLKVETLASTLLPENLILAARLFQISDGKTPLGKREGFINAQRVEAPTESDEAALTAWLEDSPENGLAVLAQHPGSQRCKEKIHQLSQSRTIVAHGGVDILRNRLTTLIGVNGDLIVQDKVSLSSEDIESDIKAGEVLTIFQREPGSDAICWAVLNCHDYTHPDIIEAVLNANIELLVVVSYNNATRLFREFAISDAHRLFCYIISVNTASIGGSGVHAPFRRIGVKPFSSFSAGTELFGTRGCGEIVVDVKLDFGELRRMKDDFVKNGFKSSTFVPDGGQMIYAVAPSERLLHTHDHGPAAPRVNGIDEFKIPPMPDKLRVAVAQLNPMSKSGYLENRYRFPIGAERNGFESVIDSHIDAMIKRCRRLGPSSSGRYLDLLVLPEVFVARDYATGCLQSLSDNLGCTIVTGVDYPSGGEAENANECFVLRPNEKTVIYRKITRSQYDAVAPSGSERMPMRRGNRLLRLIEEGDSKNGFGVLICYDYSHFDLMTELNLYSRDQPLDFVVVVANNPFADLYRSCCIADSHRFFQYIVMCNVSAYGGSGVFGPVRVPGRRQTLTEMGKGAEGITITDLDIKALRQHRMQPDDTIREGDFMRRSGIFQFGRLRGR